jgi:hypothetical protein
MLFSSPKMTHFPDVVAEVDLRREATNGVSTIKVVVGALAVRPPETPGRVFGHI